MRHELKSEEKLRLDQRIAKAEARTAAQIVLAVIERSDSYAELPWKAFALGTSIAGLLALIMNILLPLNSPPQAAFLVVMMMLAAGAGLALLSVLIPDFARIFLAGHRAETETRQYAESLFLSRKLFAMPERRTVLVTISLFERQIVILPDAGLARQISRQAADEIIHCMTSPLQKGYLTEALENGLQKIEDLIAADGPPASSGIQFSNIIEEKGA